MLHSPLRPTHQSCLKELLVTAVYPWVLWSQHVAKRCVAPCSFCMSPVRKWWCINVCQFECTFYTRGNRLNQTSVEPRNISSFCEIGWRPGNLAPRAASSKHHNTVLWFADGSMATGRLDAIQVLFVIRGFIPKPAGLWKLNSTAHVFSAKCLLAFYLVSSKCSLIFLGNRMLTKFVYGLSRHLQFLPAKSVRSRRSRSRPRHWFWSSSVWRLWIPETAIAVPSVSFPISPAR